MGAPAASHPLIVEAEAALRRLVGVPLAADAARSALSTLAARRDRTPLVAGVDGELAARTVLLDQLCGGGLLDPAAREAGCAILRLRRGDATRFRATLHDGAIEQGVLPDDRAARARVAELREALARLEAQRAATPPPPPPRWSFWRWLRRLLGRHDPVAALVAPPAELTELAAEIAALEAEMAADHGSFVARLRMLSGHAGPRSTVKEVILEVGGGRLPEGVEILELGGATRAGAQVDALIGSAEALDALPERLAGVRAGAVARDAIRSLGRMIETLTAELDRAEAGFAARIARLETRRVADPTAFIAAQLDRVRPQLVPSVHAAIEHAAAHLGAELAQLAAEWVAAIGKTSTTEQLAAAATQIEADTPAAAQRIAGEVRTLLMGAAGGAAYDMVPDLIAPLRTRGLPPDDPKVRRKAPVLPRVEVLPSLAGQDARALGDSGSWLTKLFRSLDTRRNEVLDNVEHRATRMREVASAELLDAEPRLHAAIADALTAELVAALERQQRWLDGEIATEQAAIAQERAALAALRDARDGAARASQALSLGIAELTGG